MKAQVSFGSQPQKRPQALSAQMAPAMTANVQIGKPKTAVRWAVRSSAAADGRRSSSEELAVEPVAALSSCRERSRYSTLEMPLTKKMPNPRIAVVTWTPSHHDLSAATSGPAEA